MPIQIVDYVAAHFAGVDALWRTVFPGDPPWNAAAVAIPAKLALQPELLLVALDDRSGVRPAPPKADKCWGSDPVNCHRHHHGGL